MRRLVLPGLLLLLPLAACGGDEDEQTLTVLAAASLTETFTELAEVFEDEHPGVEVELVFGSSSTLAEQAVDGAPGQVLATADEKSILARRGRRRTGRQPGTASSATGSRSSPRPTTRRHRHPGRPRRPGRRLRRVRRHGTVRRRRRRGPRVRGRSRRPRPARRSTSRPCWPAWSRARPTPGLVYRTDAVAAGRRRRGGRDRRRRRLRDHLLRRPAPRQHRRDGRPGSRVRHARAERTARATSSSRPASAGSYASERSPPRPSTRGPARARRGRRGPARGPARHPRPRHPVAHAARAPRLRGGASGAGDHRTEQPAHGRRVRRARHSPGLAAGPGRLPRPPGACARWCWSRSCCRPSWPASPWSPPSGAAD